MFLRADYLNATLKILIYWVVCVKHYGECYDREVNNGPMLMRSSHSCRYIFSCTTHDRALEYIGMHVVWQH